MKRLILLTLALSIFFAYAGLSAVKASAGTASPKDYYVCDCGPKCKCDTISTKPGKCGCDRPAARMSLLEIQGDTAIFCNCDKSCGCKISAEDPEKCSCGNPVKKVSLKGKYVCGCGPDCKCGAISNKPGKCGCGKALKKVQ